VSAVVDVGSVIESKEIRDRRAGSGAAVIVVVGVQPSAAAGDGPFSVRKVELFALGLKSPPPLIVTVLPLVFVMLDPTASDPDVILIVPPGLLIVIPRLLLIVKPAVACNVPPPNVSWPATAEPGAVPRFPSELMLSVPALIKVFSAVGVRCVKGKDAAAGLHQRTGARDWAAAEIGPLRHRIASIKY